MPKTRTQKQDTITDLSGKLARANSVVFTDYKGLTMTQLSELRKALRKNDAEFEITKNSLVKLALKDSSLTTNYSLLTTSLEGPTATLFSFGDQISPIKALVKLLKDSGTGSIKAGVLDGEYLDQYSVIKLSQLPSQNELRAKVVGSLSSPLYGIVGVLNANLRNLVYALDQIRISKGGEA